MKFFNVSFSLALAAGVLWVGVANAGTNDLLVKFKDAPSLGQFTMSTQAAGNKVENLGGGNWVRVQLENKKSLTSNMEQLRANPNVVTVQPNYPLHIFEDYRAKDPAVRAKFEKFVDLDRAIHARVLDNPPIPERPAIPTHGSGGKGADPEFVHQWGMNDIGIKAGWKYGTGKGITVAVIDTGVDYTHEDLVDNLWHNAGEMGTDAQGRDKATNGVDDDANGFVDDVIGWDFVTNDGKPFDITVDPMVIITGGGNPGHGTHCAGNVGAKADNGKGVAGVAPDAKIMVLRFLNEKGQGDTAGGVKAINYAVKMGAKVLSNSWGSEGEDPAQGAENQALRDAITSAQAAGVLFIAAAGNGHSGSGYDNDTDGKPGIPASFPYDNIISVAAIDSNDQLGGFSNWGAKTVHIAAPGVKVFSTIVGGKYSDTVIDMYGIVATWDGTSMAAPHVAGAAAAYWSKHPSASYKDVKAAILSSSKPLSVLQGKTVSGGKLNVENLMSR